jgi:hypothetical protein
MNTASQPAFEDLQTLWRQERQSAQSRLHDTLRQTLLPTLMAQRLEPGPWSIGFSLLSIALLGAYCAQQWGAWRYLVPGAALLLWCVLTLAAALHTRARLAGLDYALPVLELQRALAELRAQRLRQLRWAFVTGQVLWVVPFCVVLLRGLTGAPVLEGAMLDFALKGLAWTLALVPLQWLAWRALRRVWRGHNGLTRWGDALAGDDLAELRRLLERLQ